MISEDRNLQPADRSRRYHPQKRELVGVRPGRAPPAWKTNMAGTSGQLNGTGGKVKAPVGTGSKIFISMLPVDVVEKEVEVGAQFSKHDDVEPTIFECYTGPLPDDCRAIERVFHGIQFTGKVKGDGCRGFSETWRRCCCSNKVQWENDWWPFVTSHSVPTRIWLIFSLGRPIKIEIISDGSQTATPQTPNQPSLLDRIATAPQPLQPLQVQQPVVMNPFLNTIPSWATNIYAYNDNETYLNWS